MARFMLESEHTYEECAAELDSIAAFSRELFARFDWGCEANQHLGWVVVEAGDEATARLFLPTVIRAKARVVRLNKYTLEEVRQAHEHT